jgi:thioredoxin reductase (NADPH)
MARNVIIVGSGPAGLTAAIYTARANLRPLMFAGFTAGGPPGGQLMMTTEVENFPGFPEGVMGPQLMMDFRKQAERFGAEIRDHDVTETRLDRHPFEVVAEGEVHQGESVIISTGAAPKMLGLEGEKSLIGHGLSTCATCDGAFFRDREMIVVGGGDSALEEALFLTRFGSKVYVVHRRDEFRASKIMQERAFKNEKVEILWNTVLVDILADEAGKVRGGVLADVRSGEKTEKPIGAIFYAIGHTPNSGVFRGQVDMDENGYILARNGMMTSVDGVFVAGDVQDHVYRQAITAAGSGCMAAIDCERWLEAREAAG